jgi:hypothetical protein
MHPRNVPDPPGSPAQATARSGSPEDHAGRACLVLVRDLQLAYAVALGMKSLLAKAGRNVPVLVPPMYGEEFAAPEAEDRLRACWDGQRTGVELSAATLVIIDVEDLAGLARVAYVAVRPGQAAVRAYTRDGAVIEVPAVRVRELVDAAVSGTFGACARSEPSKTGRSVFSPESLAKPLWNRRLIQ